MLKYNTSKPEHNGFIEIQSRLTSDLMKEFIDKHKTSNEEILYSHIFIYTDVSFFSLFESQRKSIPISEI